MEGSTTRTKLELFPVSELFRAPYRVRFPLHWSAFLPELADFVGPLCAGDIAINSRDVNGDTPLHRVCAAGSLVRATILVGLGADPTRRNTASRTPQDLLTIGYPKPEGSQIADLLTLVTTGRFGEAMTVYLATPKYAQRLGTLPPQLRSWIEDRGLGVRQAPPPRAAPSEPPQSPDIAPSEGHLCVICAERPPAWVFPLCGQLCVCLVCKPQMQHEHKCPACNLGVPSANGQPSIPNVPIRVYWPD